MRVTPTTDESPILNIEDKPKEMLSVREEEGKTFVRINASSLQIIQECMRKAHLSLDQGWNSIEGSPATVFGSAIHSCLEEYYQGEIEDRELPKLETLESMAYGHYPEGWENDLCLRSFAKFLETHEPISELPDIDKRSAVNGAWIIHNYFKDFLDDPWVAYRDESGPFIERTLSLNIYNTENLSIEIFGTIDAVLRNTRSGELIPTDHKTVSFLMFGNSNYFDREKPGHQYTGYMLMCREVLGLDVSNFMVNILEVKKKPQRGKGPSFPRQITDRTQDDYAEFKETVIYEVKRYLEATKNNVWPLGPAQSCAAYGACKFRPVCSSPKSMRETILKNKFKRVSHA